MSSPYSATKRHRVLRILLRGAISRHDLDARANLENSPDVIYFLRRHYGLELPCERVRCLDTDGEPTTRGVYRPTPADRRRIALILSVDTEGAA